MVAHVLVYPEPKGEQGEGPGESWLPPPESRRVASRLRPNEAPMHGARARDRRRRRTVAVGTRERFRVPESVRGASATARDPGRHDSPSDPGVREGPGRGRRQRREPAPVLPALSPSEKQGEPMRLSRASRPRRSQGRAAGQTNKAGVCTVLPHKRWCRNRALLGMVPKAPSSA